MAALVSNRTMLKMEAEEATAKKTMADVFLHKHK